MKNYFYCIYHINLILLKYTMATVIQTPLNNIINKDINNIDEIKKYYDNYFNCRQQMIQQNYTNYMNYLNKNKNNVVLNNDNSYYQVNNNETNHESNNNNFYYSSGVFTPF